MSKPLTRMLAMFLVGLIALTSGATSAFAVGGPRTTQEAAGRTGFVQGIGRGVQNWASQRWQAAQQRHPRLAASYGGFAFGAAMFITAAAGVGTLYFRHVQQPEVATTCGIVTLVGALLAIATGGPGPRRR